jgi:hypothetical protein
MEPTANATIAITRFANGPTLHLNKRPPTGRVLVPMSIGRPVPLITNRPRTRTQTRRVLVALKITITPRPHSPPLKPRSYLQMKRHRQVQAAEAVQFSTPRPRAPRVLMGCRVLALRRLRWGMLWLVLCCYQLLLDWLSRRSIS